MEYLVKRCLTALILSSLLGCASAVKRDEPVAQAAAVEMAGQKYSKLNLYISDDAKKLLAENIKFNPEALRNTIQRVLEARNQLEAGSPYRIDIEITHFNVRSHFSAVMFGFLAGSDSVVGNVYIGDNGGRRLAKYEVSASYALGGIAGGQDEARMGWLYEEFAKQVVNELPGADRK